MSHSLINYTELTPEQVELLKTTICKGATDNELRMFVNVCNVTGLNPFLKQIHAVKRYDSETEKEVMAIQVAIDGFRLVAQRSKQYQGQTPPQWCGADGMWRDVWLENDAPKAARVGVYRRGFKEPCWGIATYLSYVQTRRDGTPNRFWKSMPDNQLAKCAEALALRKAFPQELSALRTDDEMDQADNVVDPPSNQPAERHASVRAAAAEPQEPPCTTTPPTAAATTETTNPKNANASTAATSSKAAGTTAAAAPAAASAPPPKPPAPPADLRLQEGEDVTTAHLQSAGQRLMQVAGKEHCKRILTTLNERYACGTQEGKRVSSLCPPENRRNYLADVEEEIRGWQQTAAQPKATAGAKP